MMKFRNSFKSLHHLLFACLLIFSINVCAEEVTTTYTFTNKSWGATCNGETTNWISGKDGATNNTIISGVLVSNNFSGAYAKSPVSFSNVSKVDIVYNTNGSLEKSIIDVMIDGNHYGSGEIVDKSVREGHLEFINGSISGNVCISVTNSGAAGSIYICSISITHEGTYANSIDILDYCGNSNTARFIFNTDLGLAMMQAPLNETNASLAGTYTLHNIVLTAVDGTINFNKSSRARDLRLKSTSSLTFSGENITKIEITGSSLNNLSVQDNGTYNNGTWTGNSSSVTLKSSGSVTINSIIVTYNKTDFSVSSVGYATYYNAFPYVMPEGVEGKTMVLENGTVRSKTVFTAGDVVPAETALLLKGTSKSYTITKTDAAATRLAEGNLLHGLLTEGVTTGGSDGAKYYKLANGESGLGWYYGSADNTDGHAFTSGANKAYLVLEATAYNSIAHARNFFSIEGDATVVHGLKTEEGSARTYYNLMGQRTAADAKGIVIVNGKKVLNK